MDEIVSNGTVPMRYVVNHQARDHHHRSLIEVQGVQHAMGPHLCQEEQAHLCGADRGALGWTVT
jgi:hypothetical protein